MSVMREEGMRVQTPPRPAEPKTATPPRRRERSPSTAAGGPCTSWRAVMEEGERRECTMSALRAMTEDW
eukprot:8469680-Pyramimonas_sp.AAC.1